MSTTNDFTTVQSHCHISTAATAARPTATAVEAGKKDCVTADAHDGECGVFLSTRRDSLLLPIVESMSSGSTNYFKQQALSSWLNPAAPVATRHTSIVNMRLKLLNPHVATLIVLQGVRKRLINISRASST